MTTMADKQRQLDDALTAAPVVAVVVVEEIGHAVPLARALVRGGIRAIEITLRTAVALDAIRAVAAEVEGAIVGAGTLLGPRDIAAATAAGARFGVSPGATDALLAAAADSPLPYLPGAATASEAMTLLDRGYTRQKFFPATPAGGPEYLRSLASPIPAIRFCPTGGITAQAAPEWLRLPNVVCVGGSWMCAPQLVKAGNWDEVERLARQAAVLRA
jgi:2-dehydro-3-deoxyphosphogluconate aldolase/(4S)-4-hydroxy-2-oxoglutarate aldolase